MLDVYLTVDTECSMGGAWRDEGSRPVDPERAILGKIGSSYYGTPLLMDIMEEYGLRGVFFVEVFASRVLGDAGFVEAYRQIVQRGHNVELHLHPVFHYYYLFKQKELRRDQLPANMDLIGSHPFETQVELLRDGMSLFQKLVGQSPVAFRAGCYGASDATLDAVDQVGLSYDLSHCACYLGASCLMNPNKPTNSPWRQGRVWELPVTNFETGGGWMRALKPLEIGAVSLREMKTVLEQALEMGMKSVVISLHSFSLFKKRDLQHREMCPDRLVIRRFRGLCRFLKENHANFRVTTFLERPQPSPDSHGHAPFPKMGIVVPAVRKLVQGVNRVYWV